MYITYITDVHTAYVSEVMYLCLGHARFRSCSTLVWYHAHAISHRTRCIWIPCRWRYFRQHRHHPRPCYHFQRARLRELISRLRARISKISTRQTWKAIDLDAADKPCMTGMSTNGGDATSQFAFHLQLARKKVGRCDLSSCWASGRPIQG